MDKLSILFDLFGKVVISNVVADECVLDLSRPGAVHIKKAMDKGKIEINNKRVAGELSESVDMLGAGEVSAIKLALINKIPLLIDEKLGRRAAEKLNIKIIGTVGVLLLAKRRKCIDKISPLIDTLTENGYRLSQKLIRDVLVLARETHGKNLSTQDY